MSSSLPQTSLVELRDVSVASSHAPQVPVVEQVNWFISSGDYWVVGGLPGSGKSDLLATATGLIKPLRGTHCFFGRDTFDLSQDELAKERLRLGVVFADGGRLFRHLTIAENVSLPLSYHRDAAPEEIAEIVASVLQVTGISALMHRTPAGISRHWCQRAALARALVLKPEVLFLDEPLRGLDPRQVRWWLDFIFKLHEGHSFFEGRPVTIAVVTNDLRVWADQGEKFGLINDDRWMFLGGRGDLKAHPEPLLRELLVHDFAEI